MKVLLLLLTACLMQVSAASFAQRISLSEKRVSLTSIFEKIRQQSGYDFIVTDELLAGTKPVSIHVKNQELKIVLDRIFENQPLSFTLNDRAVVVKKKEPSLLDKLANVIQSVTKDLVKGRVVDQDGKPLPNASIKIKGKNTVTNTNQNGEFEIRDVADDAVLLISYVGYKTLEIPLKDAVMPLEIKLDVQTGELEEVNVNYSTGYQSIPKERATGSFNFISNTLYNEQTGMNVLARLSNITNAVAVINAPNVPNQLTVRGLSTFLGPKNPLIVLDNFPYEGDINNINPNDVENISILKDAAAASIWGARAGNGVIVITTKKGGYNQKVKAEVNANVNIIQKPDLFYLKNIASSDFIDIEQFLFGKGFYDAYLQTAPFFYQTPVVDILEKQRKGTLDPDAAVLQLNALRKIDSRNEFLKYIYGTGVNQQYAANIRGGSANHGWVLSAGNDKNKSNLDAKFNRYNLRMDNSYRPIEKLELQAGIYYTQSKSETGKTGYNSLSTFDARLPYIRFKNDNLTEIGFNPLRNGYLDTAGRGYLLDWRYYPLQDYKHNRGTTNIQDLVARFGASYSFLKWLSADLKYQYEKQNLSGRILYDQESFYARDQINQFTQINYNTKVVTRPVPLGGILDEASNNLTVQNVRAQLNINQDWSKHHVNAIAGAELRDVTGKGKNTRTYGYDDELLSFSRVDYNKQYTHFEPAFGSLFISGNDFFSATTNRFISFYGNAAYSYDEKYTLSLSARKDASNLFGVKTNDKWTPLWSAGLAWTLSNEAFYHFKPISMLKLRATYGYSGNVATNMSSESTINYRSDKSIYTGGPIAVINNYYNPELRWEKIGMLNLGVDFQIAGNVLSGSIDYFNKKGVDLYGPAAVDRTLGLGASITKSYANLKGHGVDVVLNSNNLKGQFKWSTNLNYSFYKDKVTKYFLTVSPRADSYVWGSVPVVGYPRFALFKYKWAGLNPNTGDPQGYLNGKVSTNYRALKGDSAQFSDLVYKGGMLPVHFGSLGNQFSWNGISLNVRILYRFGHYFQRESVNYNVLFNEKKGHADYAKRWQKPGDEQITNVPSMVYPVNLNRDQFYQDAEVLTEKADHIRLQNISLGYDFTRDKFRGLPFQKLKVFVIANDLGIIWRANKFGIDPEYSGSQIPASKSISIGINANL